MGPSLSRIAGEGLTTGLRRAVIFALPLYDDNPIQEAPVVTYGLIGMCIGAFLWQLGQNADVVALQYGMIPAVLFGHAHLSPRLAAIPPWATIFTSMFLHVGGFASGVVLMLLMRPRRVMLWHAQKSPIFAATSPSALRGRRTFHGGSVPSAGQRYPRPPSPWN